MLGHNNPPDPIDTATAPYADAIEEAANWLDGAVVETEGQMQAVDALLAQIKAWRKDLDAAKKYATAPLHDAWKRELARWKPTEDDQQRIEKGLVAAVDGYKRRLAAEKEAARREAERKAWQAAEEARRAAEAANVSDLAAQREAAAKQAEFEAAMPGFVYPSDLEPSARWFGRNADVIKLTMSADGWMRVPGVSIAALLDTGRFGTAARLVLSLGATT